VAESEGVDAVVDFVVGGAVVEETSYEATLLLTLALTPVKGMERMLTEPAY